MTILFRNLIHFGRLLRASGLDVAAARMIDVAHALDHIDIGRRQDFYYTLRTLLVHRPQDLPLFDRAFRWFWREVSSLPLDPNLRALGRQRRLGPPRVVFSLEPSAGAADAAPRDEDSVAGRTVPGSYSASEVLRNRDFAHLSEAELREAKRMIASLRWTPGSRRTRRRMRDAGREPDLRRLVRRNVRYGGEPIVIPTRGRVRKPRPLVVIGDVSGSMERYARMLLHFVYSLAGGARRVEAFVFATRFTRITRELSQGHADAAAAIQAHVPDWGGGTRIGDAIRAFNVRWARRVRGRGPVVLLISDGWDRGDPVVLAREMARLARSCRRLIWLNPLIGSPGYEPLTRGMQAALPYVDDFLPAHNVNSLQALADHLNTLSDRDRARHVRLERSVRSLNKQDSGQPPQTPAPGGAATAAPVTGDPGGAVEVSYRSEPDPPVSGDNVVEVTVKGADGAPMTDGTVTVAFAMPAMPAMDMPAMRTDVALTHAGQGTYRGKGQLSMGGTWNVTVTVSRAGEQLAIKRFSVVAK